MAGLAVGLALLPGAFAANEPAVPAPQPAGTPRVTGTLSPSPDGAASTSPASPAMGEGGAYSSATGSDAPTDTPSPPYSGTGEHPGSRSTGADPYGGPPTGTATSTATSPPTGSPPPSGTSTP